MPPTVRSHQHSKPVGVAAGKFQQGEEISGEVGPQKVKSHVKRICTVEGTISQYRPPPLGAGTSHVA